MSTTAIIGEMVAIGLLGSVWLVLLVINFLGPIPNTNLVDQLDKLNEWIVPISLVATLVWYQLGWVVNGMCFLLFETTWVKKLKRRLLDEAGLKNMEYEPVRAFVYQYASETFLSELNFDRTGMRIARTCTLNFIMISAMIALLPTPHLVSIVVLLLLAAASFADARRRTRRFYKEIVDTYNHLSKRSDIDQSATPPPSYSAIRTSSTGI